MIDDDYGENFRVRFEAWKDAETRALTAEIQLWQDRCAKLESKLHSAKRRIDELEADAYQRGVEDMRRKLASAERRAKAANEYNDLVLERLQDFVDDYRTGWDSAD